MISPVCSIAASVGDDDLQVRPAVGAEQRGEPGQPLAGDPQRPGPGRARRGPRAPHTVTSTPPIVGAERAQPPGGERVVAARARAGGCRPAAARRAPRPRRRAAGRAARASRRPGTSRTRRAGSSGPAATRPPSRCASAGIALDSSATACRCAEAPRRGGHADVDVERDAAARARARAARSSCSGTALQNVARRAGRRAGDVADPDVAHARRSPAPVAPQPDPRSGRAASRPGW